MGPLKVISDGSLNTRSAWCEHPYADGSGSGAPNQSPAELRALMTRATEHGLETAIHAIGDAACHDVLAAYEETGARGSMEHAQLMTRADVALMGRLGVRASVQPAHLLDDRDVTELIWPDRADRCFPLRWMVEDGVPMAFGSDAPVSPLDPWLAIAAAVHRSADDRPAWHGEQALTPREALAASVDGQGSVHAGAPPTWCCSTPTRSTSRVRRPTRPPACGRCPSQLRGSRAGWSTATRPCRRLTTAGRGGPKARHGDGPSGRPTATLRAIVSSSTVSGSSRRSPYRSRSWSMR